LAKDWKWLDLVRAGWNPYEAHAKVAYNWPGGAKLKDSDPTLYKLSKAARLGLGYGCGWKKFIVMSKTLAALDICANDPETVTEIDPVSGEDVEVSGYGYLSKKTVAEFRAGNKCITDLWGNLDDSFRRSTGSDFTMKLPSGRVMRYENVRQAVRHVPDEKDPRKKRKKYVFTANIGGIPKEFYGGKLTENITQAVARDVFAEHIDLLDRSGMANLFSVHDEAVLEVKPDVSAKDVEEVMSTCPAWLKGCPIAAEAKETERYFK
jgi:DNA polymerase